ncbi:MAG: hypothetical protein HRT45_00455 [Bdellovibrionales bacterium]|nr:hypothetical protein [Bdellovibrionales bacterium]
MKGKDLIKAVTQSADIPSELITAELKGLLEQNSIAESHLTLDQLREVLAEYLQDVFVAAKSDLNTDY